MSLGLVAYGSSDDSSASDEEDDSAKVLFRAAEADQYEIGATTLVTRIPEAATSLNKLISDLPKPTSSVTTGYSEDDVVEEIYKKLPAAATQTLPKPKPKKVRQPVKIAALVHTNLDSDDEDDEPSLKKTKRIKGCGLIGLLPAPKNALKKETKRALIPHTLTKKPNVSKKSILAPAVATITRLPTVDTTLVSNDLSDEDDTVIDFFSFDKNPIQEKKFLHDSQPSLSGLRLPAPSVEYDEQLQHPSKSLSDFQEKYVASPNTNNFVIVSDTNLSEYGPSIDYTPSTHFGHEEENEVSFNDDHNDVQKYLQDEEFIKMTGKKNQRLEEINFIDVQANHKMDPLELMKNMTEESSVRMSHSKKKNKDMPSGQQKRKHQITYLAFQAKEREIDLKNQWAQNKMNKRSAQNKYGF